MRLHTLRLRGVGPFKDEFSIDFDEVGGQRLFLIDGDTGTGKSTIIDAIVFALYGRTADDDAGDRMVSDFLPTGFAKADRPFVELVFSVESGVYRVRREPRYLYLNRNGKEAIQNPTLRLERLVNEASETGDLISTSLMEGSSEIQRVVQLSAGQFLATVVLAQGQFATFLRAGQDDRREILERVFNTEAYRRVEVVLKERKSAAVAERNEAAARCQDAAARFHEVAALSVPAEDWRELASRDPSRAVEQAQQRKAEVEAAATEAEARKAESRAAHVVAVAAREAAERRAALVADKRTLLQQHRELLAAEPDVIANRTALAEHSRARTVEPYRVARTSTAGSLGECERATLVCFDALNAADRSVVDSASDDRDQAVRVAIAKLAADEGELSSVLILEAGLPAARAAADAAQVAAQQVAAELTAVEQTLADLPAALEGARAQVTAYSELAAALGSREQRVAEIRKGLTAARRAEDLIGQQQAATRDLDRLATALRQATDAAHLVETGYHANLAGVLAAQLVPGDPCPVCGGEDHPNPAPPPASDVTRDAVQRARDAVERQRGQVEGARARLAEVATQLASAQAVADDRPVGPWEADLVAATTAVDQARTAAQQVAKLEAEVARLDRERARLERRVVELTEQEATARADEQQRRRRIADDEVTVGAARAGFDSVALRVAALQVRRSSLEAWQRGWQAQAEAQAVADRAATALAQALVDGGFTDEHEVAAALLDRDTEARLQAVVAEHEKRRAQVEGRLEAGELAQVDAAEQVDVVGPATIAQNAEAALAAASQVATLAARQEETTSVNCEALRRAAEHLTEVAARVAPIVRIADIVNGTGANSLGVPLSYYVVLRRFEDVLEAANSRLLAISDGRYRLEPDTTAKQGQKARRGLGLRIVDERTDQGRDVTTLSGGETFYTSLSLALGLADVVQQEAGGVQMRTLFVDEGFGSLDTETLEAVMSVLGNLSKGDRMVGVISHVTEMKHSIPFRIHVRRPDRDGPSVIVTPD